MDPDRLLDLVTDPDLGRCWCASCSLFCIETSDALCFAYFSFMPTSFPSISSRMFINSVLVEEPRSDIMVDESWRRDIVPSVDFSAAMLGEGGRRRRGG